MKKKEKFWNGVPNIKKRKKECIVFCHNCGAQLPENAAFCPNCGQKITPISQPVSIQKPEAPPAEPVDAPVDSTDAPNEAPQPDPQPGPQTDNTVPPSDTVTEAEVIGSNAAYYQAQFQKIRAGEKGNFNVAAFFLSIFHAAYRGPWREWLHFMRIPLICYAVSVVCLFIGSILFISTWFCLPFIIVGVILYIASLITGLIRGIRYGFAFNELYLKYVEKQRYAEQPALGTSGKRLGISIAIVAAISIALSIASTTYGLYLLNDLFDDYDDSYYYDDSYDFSQDTTEYETTESTPAPDPEPAPAASDSSTPDTPEKPDKSASGKVEVIRYANENGRLKDLPPAETVINDVKSYGYSGSIIITPMDSGIANNSQGISWVGLDVTIYDENWTYVIDLYLYYFYSDTEDGNTTYGLYEDSTSTNYDDEATYYTRDDYLYMNEADQYYYGDSPTPGIPWFDPTTEEWTLDGELWEGGLYGN